MEQILLDSEVSESPQQVVARYFDMWNTGDSSIAFEILSPDWVDHAHPEVNSPQAVRQAVEKVRAAQPDLHFQIEAILGNDDLVAAVGSAGGRPDAGEPASRLIWLIRLKDGRMAEMWTYPGRSRIEARSAVLDLLSSSPSRLS
jgi:ketosteroid isomerase-like protein